MDPDARRSESPLRWTCKSTRKLADELTRQGHPISQGRGAAAQRGRLQPAGQPQDHGRGTHTRTATRSSSTSTPGRALPAARAAGDLGRHEEEGTGRRVQERRARVAAQGRARGGARSTTSWTRSWARSIPYGVYDMTRNEGWVSVGIDHDTAAVRRARRSAAGGRRWASTRYPTRASC